MLKTAAALRTQRSLETVARGRRPSVPMVWRTPTRLSPPMWIFCSSNPAAGTSLASMPSSVPTKETRWPRLRSSRATASPGITCPPVPPPAIRKLRSFIDSLGASSCDCRLLSGGVSRARGLAYRPSKRRLCNLRAEYPHTHGAQPLLARLPFHADLGVGFRGKFLRASPASPRLRCSQVLLFCVFHCVLTSALPRLR